MADSRILDGAVAVFAKKGLAATVDDVAEAAGVSRRTVFRHFDSHSELFAAAIDRILQTYEERFPGPPAPDEDWEQWLLRVARNIHEMNRTLLGRGFWHVLGGRPVASRPVQAALADRSDWGMQMADRLATTAWTARGARGRPPPWVVEAFGVLLSGFATAAMAAHETPEAADLSARILSAVVARAVEEPAAPAAPAGSAGS